MNAPRKRMTAAQLAAWIMSLPPEKQQQPLLVSIDGVGYELDTRLKLYGSPCVMATQHRSRVKVPEAIARRMRLPPEPGNWESKIT